MNVETVFVKNNYINIIELPNRTGVKYKNHLHMLNSSAFKIFSLCDGKRTIQDIKREMKELYPSGNIEESIEPFLNDLISLKLIKEKD
jgi:hypothetical protein